MKVAEKYAWCNPICVEIKEMCIDMHVCQCV